MYIVIGIGLLILFIILLLAAKFMPFSNMMSSFKDKSFVPFMIGLLIVAILSLSYGIYNTVTSESPLKFITYNEQKYVILGDIGKVGYFSYEPIQKDHKANLYVVSWTNSNLKDPEITITYPSGKSEVWEPKVSKISFEQTEDNAKIKTIYKLTPYTFKERGDVKLTIKTNKQKDINIGVRVQ